MATLPGKHWQRLICYYLLVEIRYYLFINDYQREQKWYQNMHWVFQPEYISWRNTILVCQTNITKQIVASSPTTSHLRHICWVFQHIIACEKIKEWKSHPIIAQKADLKKKKYVIYFSLHKVERSEQWRFYESTRNFFLNGQVKTCKFTKKNRQNRCLDFSRLTQFCHKDFSWKLALMEKGYNLTLSGYKRLRVSYLKRSLVLVKHNQ